MKENENAGQEEESNMEIIEVFPSREEDRTESETVERRLQEPTLEAEQDLVRKVMEVRTVLDSDQPRMQAFRHIEQVKIMAEVRQIDKVLDCVEITTSQS